jgi:hypothetical protein
MVYIMKKELLLGLMGISIKDYSKTTKFMDKVNGIINSK